MTAFWAPVLLSITIGDDDDDGQFYWRKKGLHIFHLFHFQSYPSVPRNLGKLTDLHFFEVDHGMDNSIDKVHVW